MATTSGRRAGLVLIGAALISAAILIPAGQARFVDGDEGFYLQAARLVAGGRHLYGDFFFPQMPLAPQVYGGWFALVGAGWRAGRLLSSLFAIATGLLLAAEARRRTERWGWGVAALALYLAAGPVLGWFTVAKTYALAALLLTAGTIVLQRPSPRATFAGALLLALAAETRLYLVAALPCAALYLVRAHPGQRPRRLLIAAAGVLVALVALVPALRDPHAFSFGAVGFHALRDPAAAHLDGQAGPKWWMLLSALGLKGAEGPGAVQLLALLVAAAAAALSPRTSRNALTTYVWIALVPASLVPTPAYPQYLCLLVPFLVLDAVSLLATVSPARAAAWLVPAGLAYASLGFFDGDRYLRTGAQVPGVEFAERRAHWSISTIAQVAAEIDAQAQPVGLSWWPGYFVATRTALPLELANDFGIVIADRVPAPERRRLHLVTHDEVRAFIGERRYSPVVVGNWATPADTAVLSGAGYRQVARVENVGIWVARDAR